MPTPRARVCPRLAAAAGSPPTGLAAKVLKACNASWEAAFTRSPAPPPAAGVRAPRAVPQLEHEIAVSGFWVPHLGQYMSAVLSSIRCGAAHDALRRTARNTVIPAGRERSGSTPPGYGLG